MTEMQYDVPNNGTMHVTINLPAFNELTTAVGAVREYRKKLEELERQLAHCILCEGDYAPDDILMRDRLRLVLVLWQFNLEREVVALIEKAAKMNPEVADYHGGVNRILKDMGAA